MRPSWIKAAKLVDEIGIDEAMTQMGWSRKSLQRAVQRVRKENDTAGANCEDSPVLVRKIIERYTEDELRAIAYGKTINPNQRREST